MSEPQPLSENDATMAHRPEVELGSTHSSLSPKENTSSGETKPAGPISTVVEIGSQLGPYLLLDKLGEGGMGAVYKARHTKLDRLVALKVLPPHVLSRSDALSRFEREMKAVGKLSHPNVVQALDAGDFGGVHYLSMEYVEGQDLQELVKARGPMSVVNACKAIRQAALGLGAAHKLGLVHRDIKPSNLFVTKQAGQIKILDMGLALLSQEETPAALTSTGQCFGTPDYMAPEQWEDAHTCDARADLYALGCTLFLLLVGRTPYGGDEYRSVPKKMMGHVRDPIPDLIALRPEVPAELNAIYRKLMAKEPKDRFASADQLAEVLAPFTRQSSPHAPREESRTTIDPPRRSTSDAAPAPSDGSPAPAIVSRSEVATLGDPLSQETPPRGPLPKWLLAAGGAAAMLLLGVIIITITNKDGTKTRIEIPGDSKVEISTSSDPQPTTLNRQPAPGWHGWPIDAPPPAIAPFNAEQAQQHQAAWAKYLGVPVEYTNSLGMKFRLIPPGEFTMGSTPTEIEAALKVAGENQRWHDGINSEGPQHKVILTQPIYLGVHEVTQGQYEQVMGKNPSHFAPMGAGKDVITGMDTTNHPVEMVNWNDAAEFCAKLSQRDKLKPFYSRADETVTRLGGTGHRLPTEAEWEFACRAGTTSKYWIGDNDADLIQTGWFILNSGGRTHAVGELKSNPFGLYDMHGNVWEWVQDWWEPTYYRQFHGAAAIDPIGPASDGSQRVLRGGYSNHNACNCLASTRGANAPTSHSSHFGFRVALSVDAVKETLAGQSALANDPDRILAEWVLTNKGSVTLENSNGWQTHTEGMLLPNDWFVVRIVDLRQGQVKSDADLDRLTRCQYLESLTLSGSRIDGSAMEWLTRLPRLKDLSVVDAKVPTSSLKELRRNPTLHLLRVLGNMVDDRLEFVRHLPALRTLNIWGPGTPDLDLLVEAPQLRFVNLGTPDPLDLDKLTALQAKHGRLRILVGWDGKRQTVGRDPVVEAARHFTDLGVECFRYGQDKGLSKADLEGDKFWSIEIRKVPATVQLSAADREQLMWLEMYHFTAEGQRDADELAKSLSQNHNLASVTMTDCDFTDAGLEHLQKLVGLRNINVLKTKVTRAGIERFHQAVPSCWITSGLGDFLPDYRIRAEARAKKGNEPATLPPK